ncbi:MAG: enoyl-CoA hydratase [Acetobacteraceae bacterium SCN 69-10]|nr:enoyl-CoA hydratase/isomerase family protein [Rhodospirillales bacterium]ODU54857.1 MAG: enoyl-CoA hydratase [Acetobacteraceae bacterium SCN 69-10]OJY64203.1 MAG: enoyl-CoA hydratase [Rhodospirillales bacterium 70-18]
MAPRVETRIEDRAAGRIAHVTVCNAAKLNILASPTIQALTEAMAALAGDAALRAAVLRGEGSRAFIGGADINEMATLDAARGRTFITALHGACAAIRALPVPVVARMQGYTLGAGLEIAAACDLRVASVGAKMGMPEVRIGIPSVIEAALLPPLIGWGRTRRLLLTGETIDAPTALAWGLVEEVVAEDALDAAIARLLTDILACGPNAIRQQKRLMAEWEELSPAGAIARGIDCFAEAWATPEPAERMAAFLAAKRR